MTQDSYTSINDVTVKVYVCWNTANVNRYSLQLLVHIPYSDPLMSHTIQRLHEQVKDERARRAADKVVCVHVCVCACVCVCVCVCTLAHTHTHTNTHTHTPTIKLTFESGFQDADQARIAQLSASTDSLQVHTHTHTHTHIRTHIHTLTLPHSRTHSHT